MFNYLISCYKPKPIRFLKIAPNRYQCFSKTLCFSIIITIRSYQYNINQGVTSPLSKFPAMPEDMPIKGSERLPINRANVIVDG